MDNSGYSRREGLVYVELLEALGADQASLLAEFGGRLLSGGPATSLRDAFCATNSTRSLDPAFLRPGRRHGRSRPTGGDQ